MTSRGDVELFLDSFHAKMKIFGILYRMTEGKTKKRLKNSKSYLLTGKS